MSQTPPTIAEYRAALQSFQSARLRRDHADLAADPQYAQIAEFFFEEIYGARDFSRRDGQAQRLSQFVGLAPGVMVRDIEQVLDLLELTNQLDDDLAHALLDRRAGLDFDEAAYERAYREADALDARARQIELVRGALYNVYQLSRRPFFDLAIGRAGPIAELAGMGDIYRFLRAGYLGIKPVKDIHRFVETICVREQLRLERIYH